MIPPGTCIEEHAAAGVVRGQGDAQPLGACVLGHRGVQVGEQVRCLGWLERISVAQDGQAGWDRG
jgi:hypothetical protein